MNWQEVLTDKTLQNLPYKIELNKQGRIEEALQNLSEATNLYLEEFPQTLSQKESQ